MQNLEIWVLRDVQNLEGDQDCQYDPYNSLCNQILSAQELAQTTLNIEAFALPGRNEALAPVMTYWNLKHLPALVFYNPETGLSFYAIDGNKITVNRIRKVLEMIPYYDWNDEIGGFVNSDGEGVDLTKEIDKKAGGLAGGAFGLPIGTSWGNCRDWLPDFLCETPKWIYALLGVIILVLTIKLIRN